MKIYIKVICGFRKDQQFTVDGDEAHKAYYLFLHPAERGVFNNGIALIGSSIQAIRPDYNATMGWNDDHMIDADDMNDMREKGVDREVRDLMYLAKNVAQSPVLSNMNLPLSEVKLLA